MKTDISLTLAQVVEDCARDSYAGTRNFAEIVGALAEVGVESYYADFRAGTTTYYCLQALRRRCL